jgi:uncharacterized protein
VRALLDVNVLVALLDASHLHHVACSAWLAKHQGKGWASCPLTQQGALRILSLPAYPNSQPVARVAERLAKAVAHPAHAFWSDDISLLQPGLLDWSRVLSSRQVCDLHLLALAVHNKGRLVTLDQHIPLAAVPSAGRQNLTVIA